MVEPICVPPDVVPQVWPHVWERLQAAFNRTDLGQFRDLEEEVFAGRSLLWVAWRDPEILAAVITRICLTENSKVCIIGACGGRSAKDWLPLMASIEQYARNDGCNKIRAMGRKGWVRLLPDFRSRLVVIEKDLV